MCSYAFKIHLTVVVLRDKKFVKKIWGPLEKYRCIVMIPKTCYFCPSEIWIKFFFFFSFHFLLENDGSFKESQSRDDRRLR